MDANPIPEAGAPPAVSTEPATEATAAGRARSPQGGAGATPEEIETVDFLFMSEAALQSSTGAARQTQIEQGYVDTVALLALSEEEQAEAMHAMPPGRRQRCISAKTSSGEVR